MYVYACGVCVWEEGLTLAELGLGVAASAAGLLLLVEGDAPAPPATRVGLGVALTKAARTLGLLAWAIITCVSHPPHPPQAIPHTAGARVPPRQLTILAYTTR
jgi:hypothetical protein